MARPTSKKGPDAAHQPIIITDKMRREIANAWAAQEGLGAGGRDGLRALTGTPAAEVAAMLERRTHG